MSTGFGRDSNEAVEFPNKSGVLMIFAREELCLVGLNGFANGKIMKNNIPDTESKSRQVSSSIFIFFRHLQIWNCPLTSHKKITFEINDYQLKSDRVGGGVTPAVLPHHRTCGSASGGS
jgi:hypothetical protein